jgi:hypothetical protein
MLRKLSEAIRHLALAKVADNPRDKKVLGDHAGDLLNALADEYIDNPEIFDDLEEVPNSDVIDSEDDFDEDDFDDDDEDDLGYRDDDFDDDDDDNY